MAKSSTAACPCLWCRPCRVHCARQKYPNTQYVFINEDATTTKTYGDDAGDARADHSHTFVIFVSFAKAIVHTQILEYTVCYFSAFRSLSFAPRTALRRREADQATCSYALPLIEINWANVAIYIYIYISTNIHIRWSLFSYLVCYYSSRAEPFVLAVDHLACSRRVRAAVGRWPYIRDTHVGDHEAVDACAFICFSHSYPLDKCVASTCIYHIPRTTAEQANSYMPRCHIISSNTQHK